MTVDAVTAATVSAELVRDRADRIATRRLFRRLPVELRAHVAHTFRGLQVTVTDKHARTYTGRVLTAARTTDGNVAHVLVVDPGPGLWPVALSLATIDRIEETGP